MRSRTDRFPLMLPVLMYGQVFHIPVESMEARRPIAKHKFTADGVMPNPGDPQEFGDEYEARITITLRGDMAKKYLAEADTRDRQPMRFL